MAGGQLVFQPLKFDWHAKDQQLAFDEWKGQITLALRASSINRDIWFASIIRYLGKEGFKRWNTLPISTDEEAQKDPEKSSKPSRTPLKSQHRTGTTLTRYIVTSNKARMRQLTSLTSELNTSWRDASTQSKRRWYVELNSCFMRLNILR